MLDSITTSVGQLQTIFHPIYEDLNSLLTENLPSKFQLTDEWERGVIYLFSDDYKRRYLPNLQNYAEIRYKLVAKQNLKRAPMKFEVQFSYLCDDRQDYEKQNVICFQLFDNSEKQFLDQDLLDAIKQNVPETWRTDFFDDCSSIWIEFDMDENLSAEKINQCAEDFKEHVLKPVLDKLKK